MTGAGSPRVGPGGLILTTQERLEPAASISVGPTNSSPRDLQRDLWHPDRTDMTERLLAALRELVGGKHPVDAEETLIDLGVTALHEEYHRASDEYHYADLAARALESSKNCIRLLTVTRQLGSSTSIGPNSSLEDVVDGPVAILAAAPSTPTVEIDVDGLRDLKTNQQRQLVEYILGLTQGVEVRLLGSRLTIQRLIHEHGESLPESVTERAKSRLGGSPHVATRTELTWRRAELALDHLGNHVDLSRLAWIADRPGARVSYGELEQAVEVDLDTRDAVRAFAARCEDGHIEDLLETDVVAGGIDEDVTLADRVTIQGERHLELSAVGERLAELWQDSRDSPDPDPSPSVGATDGRSRASDGTPEDAAEDAASGGVTDPPKPPSSTVYSQRGREGPDSPGGGCGDGDRRTAPVDSSQEAAAAAAGGADSSRGTLSVDTLARSEHHAAAATAAPGEIAVCKRPLGDTADSAVTSWSYDSDRDEVVVSVEASSKAALTMTRLCQALCSPYGLHQVLTPENLAGSPDRNGLGGLPIENGHVLRKGGCFGWLRRVDERADRFLDRLVEARDELLGMTSDLDAGDGSLDEDQASELLRKAHGLHGVLSRLYDMLGISVVREVRLPEWALEDEARRRNVAKMLGRACSIGGRYGVYSAYRVLYEDREPKREDLLGAPEIDADDPLGEVCGSWVLSGPTVDQLVDDGLNMEADLELQEDGEDFAPFVLETSVVDGNRREAIATAVSRYLPFKNLSETRQTVSLLDAVLGDVFTVTEALERLGTEDRPRDLDYHDVRYGISRLEGAIPAKVLPDVGAATVSKVFHALTDADRPLSTSELAEVAGTTTQSIRDNAVHFDVLEELELLEREEQGAGQATLWRLRLPYRQERLDSDRPTPGVTPERTGSTGLYRLTHGSIGQLCYALVDDYGWSLGFDVNGELAREAWFGSVADRDVSPLLEEHPQLRPWARLLVALLDEPVATLEKPYSALEDSEPSRWGVGHLATVELGVEPSRPGTQVSLQKAAGGC